MRGSVVVDTLTILVEQNNSIELYGKMIRHGHIEESRHFHYSRFLDCDEVLIYRGRDVPCILGLVYVYGQDDTPQ